MKSLQEYISNDMKSFKTSLEESLLDDFDDLESTSDDNVSKSLSIGSEWEIASTDDFQVVDKMDKRTLKKYSTCWDQTNFKAFRGYRNRSLKKPNKTEIAIANIVLSLSKESLLVEDPKPGNELYDFFQNIMQKHFDEVHKSSLYFNPNVEKGKVSMYCEKSMVKGYYYIHVMIGGGYSFEISLKKKE